MDQLIDLYKEEIAQYKEQVEDLKKSNQDYNARNNALVNRIHCLEDLVEKANRANEDLNIAFEHVHQENLRNTLPTNALPIAEVNSDKDKLDTESLVWISERDQFKRRVKFLERECARYHQDNIHLGKQVRHLLKTLEEERGMIIRRQSESTAAITCAADVIDNHLITFESIEELQQKNQSLLSLVKTLSAEQEEREIKVESEEVTQLTAKMNDLKSQLDTLKVDRDRVLNTLNTIHRERDLFKILLCKTRNVEHMTPEIFQRMVSIACSSGTAITNKESSIENEAHIQHLKDSISTLEGNLAAIKSDLEESRSASAAELGLKSELLEKAKIRISELLKQQEASTERNNMLESNYQALTIEFEEVRTRCQKMTLELEEANKLAEHATSLGQELELERKRLQDAIIEKSQVEERFRQLLESFDREKQSLTSIFSDLQDRKTRELEEKTTKLVALQLKLSDTERELEEKTTRQVALQLKLSDTERELEGKNTELATLQLRLSDTEAIQPKSSDPERVPQSVQTQTAETIQAVSSEKIEDIEAQAARCSELQQQLTKALHDIARMQHQRNVERHRRLNLARIAFGLPRKVNRVKRAPERLKNVSVTPPAPTVQEPTLEPLQNPAQDSPAQDYPAQDYPAQDYPAQDYPAQDYPAQDYPAQDYPTREYHAQEYPAQENPAQKSPSAAAPFKLKRRKI